MEANDDRWYRRAGDPIHTELEHRVFYVAKYEDAVYVIHAFEKRTPQTREADLALARTRLADFLRLRGQKRKKAR